jgi:hypothetical protein
MRQVRRWAIGGLTTAAAGVFMAAAAWACVSGPVVNLSTINAKAGQEVGLTGTGFQAANAAQIRWNALDGPVLATVPAPITGGLMDAKFTVPTGTQPGSYVVIVTQTKADGTLSLSPVRAVMSVTGEAGTNPVLGASAASTDQTVRADGLARSDDSISTGTLALVALGVGGVGMFLAGMAALFAGRKGSAPEAAKARS